MALQPKHTRSSVDRRLSVAPMMDVSDRHFRWMIRQISRRTLLWSEMVTTGALLRGDKARHLDFSELEHPVVLQLGGDDPGALAECAALAEQWGYDEVNLNCGCPSPRVSAGSFGACLMKTPLRVAAAVAAMKAACRLPVTVKHRIGVDELDRYENLRAFAGTVVDAGADALVVHARIAWLEGLSPAENRSVPPLRYPDVWRLKEELPHVEIALNGGIRSLDAAWEQLRHVDGVMIGRGVAEDPWMLADADRRLGGTFTPGSRAQVARAVAGYASEAHGRGFRPHHALRHLLPLYAGQPGGRRWRRALTEGIAAGEGPRAIVERALASVARAAEPVGFVAEQEVEGRQ
jgi:tRNA-dihydrouridine synthase A